MQAAVRETLDAVTQCENEVTRCENERAAGGDPVAGGDPPPPPLIFELGLPDLPSMPHWCWASVVAPRLRRQMLVVTPALTKALRLVFAQVDPASGILRDPSGAEAEQLWRQVAAAWPTIPRSGSSGLGRLRTAWRRCGQFMETAAAQAATGIPTRKLVVPGTERCSVTQAPQVGVHEKELGCVQSVEMRSASAWAIDRWLPGLFLTATLLGMASAHQQAKAMAKAKKIRKKDIPEMAQKIAKKETKNLMQMAAATSEYLIK
jgi:hypothetical protein